MDNTELKKDILDLLNQLAIKLEKVETPKIDDEYYDDYYYSTIPVDFLHEKGKDLTLPCVKVVVQGLLQDLDKGSKSWRTETEKMARAYYSSFCNG